jgi:hypothetical protein
MSEENERQQWRDLAVQTVRNLAALVEQAESLLRQAQEKLEQLEAKRD